MAAFCLTAITSSSLRERADARNAEEGLEALEEFGLVLLVVSHKRLLQTSAIPEGRHSTPPVAAMVSPLAAFLTPLRTNPCGVAMGRAHPPAFRPGPVPASQVPESIGPCISRSRRHADHRIPRRRRRAYSDKSSASGTTRQHRAGRQQCAAQQFLFHKLRTSQLDGPPAGEHALRT